MEDHCKSKSSGFSLRSRYFPQARPRAVCRNGQCRGISQRAKEKPIRLKSPAAPSVFVDNTPEKDEQGGSPNELPLDTHPPPASPCGQTCEGSDPSNVHFCGESGVRMNDGTLPLEKAHGVMEEGQPMALPSEVGEKATTDSREAQMEAQEEEHRKRWEEEDEDEQAAWLAMRGGDETLEEELELRKEEIPRLLQDQYRDALEHVRGKTISVEHSRTAVIEILAFCSLRIRITYVVLGLWFLFIFRGYDIRKIAKGGSIPLVLRWPKGNPS